MHRNYESRVEILVLGFPPNSRLLQELLHDERLYLVSASICRRTSRQPDLSYSRFSFRQSLKTFLFRQCEPPPAPFTSLCNLLSETRNIMRQSLEIKNTWEYTESATERSSMMNVARREKERSLKPLNEVTVPVQWLKRTKRHWWTDIRIRDQRVRKDVRNTILSCTVNTIIVLRNRSTILHSVHHYKLQTGNRTMTTESCKKKAGPMALSRVNNSVCAVPVTVFCWMMLTIPCCLVVNL